MKSEQLKEKTIQLGIQAMKKHKGYFERAKYVCEELQKEEGLWACTIVQNSVVTKTTSYYTYYGGNQIKFKIGECLFEVFKQGV